MPGPTADAYQKLISPCLPDLYRVAWRLCGNRPDAEDLVQDTCVLACQHLAQLFAAEHPGRWLVRILVNRFIDGTRRQGRAPVVAHADESGADALASAEPGPDELALRDERERAVLRACDRLSDSHRALLSLRAEGYGLVEIEQITGISREVLRARLHRARLNLARYLDEDSEEAAPLPRLGSTP